MMWSFAFGASVPHVLSICTEDQTTRIPKDVISPERHRICSKVATFVNMQVLKLESK